MISLLRRTRWKTRSSENAISQEAQSTPATAPPGINALRPQAFPSPVIRWVGEGRIAIRSFVIEADTDAICSFQAETYALNFPDFQYTPKFAEAFRYDLRRAALDPNHGIYVLDDGREAKPGSKSNSRQKTANIAGFLWVVLCQNNWSGERFGYVNNLYVAPARRGAGLSKELMKQSDDWFRMRGIKRVRLTVTSTNESAVALYRSCGYAVDRWEMEKLL